MNKKRWAALGIAIGVLIFSGITQTARFFNGVSDDEIFGFVDSVFGDGRFSEEVIQPGNWNERIVVLNVHGPIIDGGGLFSGGEFSHQAFLQKLDQIENDPSVRGIILSVNTSGGGVFESAQIASRLDRLQDEFGLPIYVSMGSMAASGGYYIAAGADRIFASRQTWTGSLAAVISSLNFSGLMEEWGIEDQTVASGEHKTLGSATIPMSAGDRAILQSLVDNAHDDFVEVIARGRGMDEAQARNLADGRIFDGIQALEAGLIDEIGYQEDAIAAMRRDFNLEDAEVFSLMENHGFGSLFWVRAAELLSLSQSSQGVLSSLETNHAPRLFFIWGGR